MTLDAGVPLRFYGIIVKAVVFRHFLILSTLALTTACGSEPTPACEDTRWFDSLEQSQARLTSAPRFSSSEIRPGDPLTVFVPVNEKARTVSVGIRSVNQTPPGSGGRAETDGGEIVEIPIEDTNLSPGVYVADSVLMWGEIAPDFGGYEVRDASLRYQFWTTFGTDGPTSWCVTDVAAPTFVVVGDGGSTSRE